MMLQATLQRMGGARAILATAPSGNAMGPLVSGLAAHGKFIVVGAPQGQMQLSAFPLVNAVPGTLVRARRRLCPVQPPFDINFTVPERRPAHFLRPIESGCPEGVGGQW